MPRALRGALAVALSFHSWSILIAQTAHACRRRRRCLPTSPRLGRTGIRQLVSLRRHSRAHSRSHRMSHRSHSHRRSHHRRSRSHRRSQRRSNSRSSNSRSSRARQSGTTLQPRSPPPHRHRMSHRSRSHRHHRRSRSHRRSHRHHRRSSNSRSSRRISRARQRGTKLQPPRPPPPRRSSRGHAARRPRSARSTRRGTASTAAGEARTAASTRPPITQSGTQRRMLGASSACGSTARQRESRLASGRVCQKPSRSSFPRAACRCSRRREMRWATSMLSLRKKVACVITSEKRFFRRGHLEKRSPALGHPGPLYKALC